MEITQSGNSLHVGLPRKGSKIEIKICGDDGHPKEKLKFVPDGILWLIFKQDGILTINNSYKSIGLKIEFPMPIKGSAELVFTNFVGGLDIGIQKATFLWENGALTLDTKTP